jgi:drug/metabolite transporter (DMT)-like permease
MVLIGVLFLKEKLTWQEAGVGLVMLVLMAYVTTRGTFQVTDIPLGVVYLLLVPVGWNVGHALIKPYIQHGMLSVVEFVFIRISFTVVILTFAGVLLGGFDEIAVLLVPGALISIIGMGVLLGLSHTAWYSTVKRLNLSLASLIVIPSPVVTACFYYFLLHQPLFVYHYVGIFGVILCLLSLMRLQRRKS